MKWPHGADGERSGRRPLDDQTAQRLVVDRQHAETGDLADLAALVEELRSLAHGSVPPPSPALARMLRGSSACPRPASAAKSGRSQVK